MPTDTALVLAEPNDPVVPDERLRPVPRVVESAVLLVPYSALLAASFVSSGILSLAAIAYLLWHMIRKRRAWYRMVGLQRDLLAALDKDDIGKATNLGRELVVEGPRMGLAHVVAISNWAAVELYRGNPRRTIELLQRVFDSGRMRGRMGRILEVWRLRGLLAYAYVVVGEVDEARRELQKADEGAGPSHRGALFNTHMVLLLRTEGAAAAMRRFDAEFRDAEGLLRVNGARAARMFEAFALEQQGVDDYRSDAGARLDRALDRAREARRGAFDFIAVEWPELAEFLRRHGLAA